MTKETILEECVGAYQMPEKLHIRIGVAMAKYAKLKCEEQRKNCQRALCDGFGATSHNYEETINNGSINAPEPKFD